MKSAGVDREVVGHVEVRQPAADVADFHRHARQHLLLQRAADLPVARTNAPALEDPGIARSTTLVGVPNVAALSAAQKSPPRGAVVLGRAGSTGCSPARSCRWRRSTSAWRSSPGASSAPAASRRRCRSRPLRGSGPVELQRRLAVAEHVVGHADPRRDVVVAEHALLSGNTIAWERNFVGPICCSG